MIEVEIRPKTQGVIMEDEKHSAHQFSIREVSIQADSEVRLELDMYASEVSKNLEGNFSPVNNSVSRSIRSLNIGKT